MKSRENKFIAGFLCLLLALAFVNEAWASATGKIVGRVIGKETNEPLVGANVIVTGTTLGAGR